MAELAASGRIAPRRYEGVAVMFADIIGFTAYCDCHAAEGVVAELDLFARGCERLAATHGLEKIKTVGDAVLLTGNLLLPHPEPVRACIACADAMIETAAELPGRWRVRAGIQLGPVVAGMVGEEKFGFDIWGDTVNLAARLSELTSEPGIHLGGAAADRVRGVVGLADLGQVALKGAAQASVPRASAGTRGALSSPCLVWAFAGARCWPSCASAASRRWPQPPPHTTLFKSVARSIGSVRGGRQWQSQCSTSRVPGYRSAAV